MLSSRDPGQPGIPPLWTENYDTYERALGEYLQEKRRQNRRRFFLVMVISVMTLAAGIAIGVYATNPP